MFRIKEIEQIRHSLGSFPAKPCDYGITWDQFLYNGDPSDSTEVKVQVTPPALTQFVEPQVSAFATPAKQNATANIAANITIFFISCYLLNLLSL